MDDLQFRRAIYADPNTEDDDINQAINDDPAKRKLVQDLKRVDKKIADALDNSIPDNLAEKLILRQTLASHRQQKRRSKLTIALAASVTLALGATLHFMQYSHSYTTIGDYAIAHVNHEAPFYHNDMLDNVSLTTLNNKMANFNGSFNEKMGQLIMADFCQFDGMESLHLIFRGKTSPVNVFIIPQNEHLTFSSSFANDKLKGLAQDFKNNQIIVVGDNTEPLKQWQDRIAKNIRWSI